MGGNYQRFRGISAAVRTVPPALEESVHQARTQVGVSIEAAVAHDDGSVICVAGVEERRQDHTAGGDAKEDQRVDLPRPQDHLQVCAREGADAVFRDDDVGFRRAERCMDRVGRTLEKPLVLRGMKDRSEERVWGFTSGRPGRNPTRMWITVIPLARAPSKTLAARAIRSAWFVA